MTYDEFHLEADFKSQLILIVIVLAKSILTNKITEYICPTFLIQ